MLLDQLRWSFYMKGLCALERSSGTREHLIGRLFALLFCLLLITKHLYSADTVTLTNGNKLTCEVETLKDGKLTVKIGYADDTELTFDWKMVSAMTSEADLELRLDD